MSRTKYLVIAYRYGTNEYFFPVGVFSARELALQAATQHRFHRGGKYDHKLFILEEEDEYDAEEVKGVWITGNNSTL